MATSGFINNIVAQVSQYKDEDGLINITKEDGVSGQEILRNIVDSSQLPKRPPSGYFLWLADNRGKIKQTYFSDYESIENWDLDSKKDYYNAKGLDWKDTLKEGKPKIVALVTSKAGKMWKEISVEDKQDYLDKSEILKDEYSQNIKKFKDTDKSAKKTKAKKSKDTKSDGAASASASASESDKPKKKGRGRPKKVKEEINSVTDSAIKKTEDTNEVDVTEEIVNGKTYYLDESSGQLYDPESGDSVGEKLDDGTYKWN